MTPYFTFQNQNWQWINNDDENIPGPISISCDILSQVTWQVIWPRLWTQVTCRFFCLPFLKWFHTSLGPKSLDLICRAPYYCSTNGKLLTSPCININPIVTSLNIAIHRVLTMKFWLAALLPESSSTCTCANNKYMVPVDACMLAIHNLVAKPGNKIAEPSWPDP